MVTREEKLSGRDLKVAGAETPLEVPAITLPVLQDGGPLGLQLLGFADRDAFSIAGGLLAVLKASQGCQSN